MSRLPKIRVSRTTWVARVLIAAVPVVAIPVLLVAQPSSAGAPAAGSVVVPDPAVTPLFTRLDRFSVRSTDGAGHRATVLPADFTAYRLDPDEMRAALTSAPSASSPVTIALPDPSGGVQQFSVVEDSVMEPGLAAKHPEIISYAGRSVDGPSRSIRLDVGTLGFHASVRSPGSGNAWYVDPAYTRTAETRYLSYYGAAVPAADDVLVERGPVDTAAIVASAPTTAPVARPAADAVVTQRIYRMAFVTDPTYAAYFGSPANVMSAKVALLNRTDQIYNDDVAVKFVLINGTDRLNLDTVEKASGPNGPCGADACYSKDVYASDGTTTTPTGGGAAVPDAPDGCDGALLTRNEFVLGQIVGADNFDIGHIGLGVNGGGIAGLGVVGGASKASGCTGLPFPTGDFYAVDYFSHEVGHEMGGNHTFNGTQANCSLTNRNGGTSVEPGSGTSVMAYAGICGQDNTQPHSDPYFSQRSIDEFDATITAAPTAVDEVQTVTLAGFDATGDSFQLTYPGVAPVTLTYGELGFNRVTILAAVSQLTGCTLPRIRGYDDGTQVDFNGFQATFDTDCTGQDLSRLGIGTTTGGVTGFVGVQQNGGDSTNQGSSTVTIGNHAPKVTAPTDKTIPARTPFTLTGSATDVDPGDTGKLIYVWEQNDTGSVSPTGGTALVSNTKIDGPLFRVFGRYADVSTNNSLMTPAPGENIADGTPSRTFPDIDQVIAGNTNAKTGACPTAPPIDATIPAGRTNVSVPLIECYSEFLPTADYGALAAGLPAVTNPSLDFRLTARDLFPTGGGTQFDDVALTVDNSAGPFLVTSRGAPGTSTGAGCAETVAWDVNGTDDASMAPNVRISLSTDGGRTYPTVLVATTPNDGSQSVTLPNVSTSTARIKVEAVDNYFFDLDDADFSITPGAVCTTPAPSPTTSASPTATPTATTTPTVLPTPTTSTGPTRTPDPTATPTSSPSPTATPTPTAPVRTRTRIRLPSPVQRQGSSVRLLLQVVGPQASTSTVGRAVVKLDGRKVKTYATRVTLKNGKTVVGFGYRVPAGLARGRHTFQVVFKPTDARAFTSSKSRRITLTVVPRGGRG